MDTLFKISAHFADDILNMMNVTREFLYTHSFGYRVQKNGTNETYLDGQTGDLVSNRSDLGATACLINPDRAAAVNCLLPTVRSYGAVIFRSPPLTYVHNLFTLPFGNSLWVASSFFIFIILVLIYGTAVWESSLRRVRYIRLSDSRYDCLRV